MQLQILINSIDRTDRFIFPEFTKTDTINQNKDTAILKVRQTADADWFPAVNDEIIINDDGERIFGGAITSISKKATVVNQLELSVECTDFSFYLDRRLILERFRNRTINFIFNFLLDKYDTDGFTMNNVMGGDQSIGSISFNRITLSEAIQKLADSIGYSWYVDYNKDIHFFPKNAEPAPFELTDTSNNFIWDSLEITENISQIRNAVFVEGGEERGNERTEEFTASGDTDERTYYRLAHKFAETPTVTVNGTPVDVGAEFLTDDSTVDAQWSFQEKYIRFTEGNIPALNDDIVVVGIPLFPVIVRVQSPPSIAEFGEWEFVVRDNSIRSRDEGLDRARAELESYKRGLNEGKFRTYTAGLRAGQVITINSDIRGINEQFLIQRVTYSTRTQDSGEYNVQLATLRTVTLIDLLQGMLKEKGVREGEVETLLTFLDFIDSATGTDEIVDISTTTGPYHWTNPDGSVPNDKQPFIWNYSTWS
jgi:hypothetical protein